MQLLSKDQENASKAQWCMDEKDKLGASRTCFYQLSKIESRYPTIHLHSIAKPPHSPGARLSFLPRRSRGAAHWPRPPATWELGLARRLTHLAGAGGTCMEDQEPFRWFGADG